MNISNGPDKPREDFLTHLRREQIKGAWEGSCGTVMKIRRIS